MPWFVHHGGWNPNVDREIKLHTELGRKKKADLIKIGQELGFEFQVGDKKADMVVELAAETMRREYEEKNIGEDIYKSD